MSLEILLFAIIAVMVATPIVDALADWYRKLPSPAGDAPDNPLRRMRRVAAAKTAKRRHRRAETTAQRLLHQMSGTGPHPIQAGGEGGNTEHPEPAPQLLGRIAPDQHRASDVRPYVGEQRGKHWLRDEVHDTGTFPAVTADTSRPAAAVNPLFEPKTLVGAEQ